MESNDQNNQYSWSIFSLCFRRSETSRIDCWKGGGYAGSPIQPSFSRHVAYHLIDDGYMYHVWKYLVAPSSRYFFIEWFMFDLMCVLCDLCVFVIGKLEKYDFYSKNNVFISKQFRSSCNHWIFDILIKTHYIHTGVYGLEAPSANIE